MHGFSHHLHTRILELAGAWSARWASVPRIGPLRGGAGAGRFTHDEWTALLGRFAAQGCVDYAGLQRVQRLVEVYLHRLATAAPEQFIDSNDQAALYLNAYNAIVVHQVLLSATPASPRTIPAFRLRPYPVGKHLVSLQLLEHVILPAYDPLLPLAVTPGVRGAPPLPATAFNGQVLQQQTEAVIGAWLGDPVHGLRYNPATAALLLPDRIAQMQPFPRRSALSFWRTTLQPWLMQHRADNPDWSPSLLALPGKPVRRVGFFATNAEINSCR